MKKLFWIVGVAGVITLLFVYYTYNPNSYSFFPKCPFHQLTGFDCPGCGSQRAIYSLLHGNIKQATHLNLLLVLSIPFLLIHATYKAYSVIKQQPVSWQVIHHPLTPKIVLVLVLIFWVLRNIPIEPFISFAA